MALQNRYEFMYYVACTNANPNGDPDMGNMPRIDPQTMQGFITDVATKRRIRNYIEIAYQGVPGMGIFVQKAVNLNKQIALAKREAGIEGAKRKKSGLCGAQKGVRTLLRCARLWGCDVYWPQCGASPRSCSTCFRQEFGFGTAVGHIHHAHGGGIGRK